MSRIKLPVWRDKFGFVYDANDVFVADCYAFTNTVVAAINAAPLTKAERAVVKAAMGWDRSFTRDRNGFSSPHAVVRLRAAATGPAPPEHGGTSGSRHA